MSQINPQIYNQLNCMVQEIPTKVKPYNGEYRQYQGMVECPTCERLMPTGKGKLPKCPYCEQLLIW